MLIFSQGPTKHSRLGNSLVWMLKMHSFMKSNNLNGFFPWAIENFGNYLPSSSSWLVCPPIAKEWYQSTFDSDITAKNISQLSRKTEHDYEKENSLEPFQWKSLNLLNPKFRYVTGSVDLSNSDVVSSLRSDGYVICHEPYNFKFPEYSDDELDFNSIAPGLEVFIDQLNFLKATSNSKPTVGLHIRRGDYSKWSNGDFYYGDDFWINIVNSKVKNGFVPWIFSNDLEPLFVSQLMDAGAIVHQEDFDKDFIRFMCVDQIIGPPSTFSKMAANVGIKAFSRNIEYFQLPRINELSGWVSKNL
jgi:hypothetical protein